MTSRGPVSLTRYAWLSIGAAITTIGLKGSAYFLTGSVGLLSDALESLVNLAGAIVALWMLSIAERPPDDVHAYGHGKAEYFASGVEGGLILLAAVSIAWASVLRLITPHPLEQTGIGLGISAIASVVNFAVARVLLRAGREHNSITLEADARHLMTDVWTSVGVIGGVALTTSTGWLRLDPLVALAVAGNIVWQGCDLVRRSVDGLMDRALKPEDVTAIDRVLEAYKAQGLQFHAIRSRQAGARRFVSFHVLVPGSWTVARGHEVLEGIESEIRALFPAITVFTHLEPLDDPRSFSDIRLDRTSGA